MSARQRDNATAPAPRIGNGPGRPKDLAKRQAILRAATELFMEQGFAATSMDAVAAAAGVSKLTVYSHFGDKEGLFNASVHSTCVAAVPDTLFQPDHDAPLREQLLQIARAFFALVSSPAALATQRMMMDPSTDDHIRQLFWQAGPRRMTATFVAYLQQHADAGHLVIPDIGVAANQFFCLVKGELLTNLICGLTQDSAPDAVESHVNAAVDFFLRAHSPR